MGTFADEVRAKLPLSVSDYMGLCNRHYYGTRDPLGAKDFITSPEISQIFGEIIGAFIAHIWQANGGQSFNLIEAGPGRGTLMADILRTGQKVDGFTEAADVHLIECSETLKAAQKTALADTGRPPRWAEDISEIGLKNKNNILILNEFMDVLPASQYEFGVDGQWRERMVVAKEGQLAFAPGETVSLIFPYACTPNVTAEIAPVRVDFMKRASIGIAKGGGMAIIIDYGTGKWGPGDSLQAMKGHKFVNPLAEPGEADITTHVDFAALESAAYGAGLYVHPLMTQGAFLDHLGGQIRAQKLGKEADYARLANLDQMGGLFKVLVVAHPDWAPSLKEVLP